MGASLQLSAHSDKRRTSNVLTPELLLEIAQASIVKLRQGGVTINFFRKDHATVLILEGVSVCFQCGSWQLWEHMTGNLCQQCTDARQQCPP